jgi:hypothetical protein
MSDKVDDGGPAFPFAVQRDFHAAETGMTLRDWFAGRALQGLIAKTPLIDREGVNGKQMTQHEINQLRDDFAESAYFYADAMLAARKGARDE